MTSATIPITYACAGCGCGIPADAPVPLRCPRAAPDDDIDHVLGRVLDLDRLAFPTGDEPNPFVRYRSLAHAWHLAQAHGWTDARYAELIEGLDAEIAAVNGIGFQVTPFRRQDELSQRLGFNPRGGVFVKDETGNVSGSHKARHLMGTLVELLIAESIAGVDRPPRLAIASCGNAALGAAVVARAARRDLDVFIPTDANPAVVDRLLDLGAHVVICERRTGVAGDPTVAALHQAVGAGAIAFTCQGNENGLAIEGGLTLADELVSQLAASGGTLDRLFVQVGGGMLASSLAQGLDEARRLGATTSAPAIHPVQATAVAPLVRAFDRLAQRLDGEAPTEDALAWAAHHRSAFMWPWEAEPRSVATGIIDDETYDWLAVVRGTLASGGRPVAVGEATLLEANDLAVNTTGIDVDPTGSAGLAGVVELRRHGHIDPAESVGVIFTGIRRGPTPASQPQQQPTDRNGEPR
jgi:threonine synthase